jgi:hypothetical protein
MPPKHIRPQPRSVTEKSQKVSAAEGALGACGAPRGTERLREYRRASPMAGSFQVSLHCMESAQPPQHSDLLKRPLDRHLGVPISASQDADISTLRCRYQHPRMPIHVASGHVACGHRGNLSVPSMAVGDMTQRVIEGTSGFLRCPPVTCRHGYAKETPRSLGYPTRHVASGNVRGVRDKPRSGVASAKSGAQWTQPCAGQHRDW